MVPKQQVVERKPADPITAARRAANKIRRAVERLNVALAAGSAHGLMVHVNVRSEETDSEDSEQYRVKAVDVVSILSELSL